MKRRLQLAWTRFFPGAEETILHVGAHRSRPDHPLLACRDVAAGERPTDLVAIVLQELPAQSLECGRWKSRLIGRCVVHVHLVLLAQLAQKLCRLPLLPCSWVQVLFLLLLLPGFAYGDRERPIQGVVPGSQLRSEDSCHPRRQAKGSVRGGNTAIEGSRLREGVVDKLVLVEGRGLEGFGRGHVRLGRALRPSCRRPALEGHLKVIVSGFLRT
mmetsp:Transcript_57433/g.107676  ORF Transcript_57433/g.107676 Transcript_57433/m.107676 type:complete len:214 (-) Transcript_57433:439-1080(-)